MPKLVDELEQFEEELEKSRTEEDDSHDLNPVVPEDKTEDEDKGEDPEPGPDEKGQEAESDKGDEKPEPPKQDDDPAPPKKITTLPDDPEVFGDFAGKEITADDLAGSDLLTKLVTWGHQGRHLVQKTQAELEAAKAEKSEAQKLRELLQERFEREDEASKAEPEPKVSDEEFAAAVTKEYLPGLQQLAEGNGIEKEFLSDFPKVAAGLEHRFQSGSNLIAALAKEISDIREFVGMAKEKFEKEQAEHEKSTAVSTFASTVHEVSKQEGLFVPLKNADTQKAFVEWITREDSGLRIADKDIGEITRADVESAWLLYVHNHPEVVKTKKKETDSHLAGGGGGKGSSASKTPSKPDPDDELGNFERQLREAEKQSWDD